MNKFAVFLSGVNVGGNNIIKMSELKSALTVNGFKNVESYINSGNIIVSHNDDMAKVKNIIKEIIESEFKLNIEMVIKTESGIGGIIRNDPFNKTEDDNSKKVVVMLSGTADKKMVSMFKNDERIEENYYHHDDLIYVYYHNGAGKSKFTTSYIEKKLNVFCTARNWNTILKMNQMLLID